MVFPYEQETLIPFVCHCLTNIKKSSVSYQGPKFYNFLNAGIINLISPASFKNTLFICNNYLVILRIVFLSPQIVLVKYSVTLVFDVVINCILLNLC